MAVEDILVANLLHSEPCRQNYINQFQHRKEKLYSGCASCTWAGSSCYAQNPRNLEDTRQLWCHSTLPLNTYSERRSTKGRRALNATRIAIHEASQLCPRSPVLTKVRYSFCCTRLTLHLRRTKSERALLPVVLW